MVYVLGAPGSGKSAVLPMLREALPGWAVLDWDWLMPAVEALTGRPVRQHEDLWDPYAELVRSVVAGLGSVPVLVATVCTPDELDHIDGGWPAGEWLLLDCDDDERARRLRGRGESDDVVASAHGDAAGYRALAMPAVDTSALTTAETAAAVAAWVGRA